jgi:hypothetical protein
MGMQQDKDFVKSMWQYQSAVDEINNGNYEDAIILLRHAVIALGIANGSPDNLLKDPGYGQYAYDESVKNLVKNIERTGFSAHGAISYAFVIKKIADSYNVMGDPANAVIWRAKLLDILENHSEINKIGLD